MSSPEEIRQERSKWFGWKNIAPIKAMIDALPAIASEVMIDDSVSISFEPSYDEEVTAVAKALKPWRKGPFSVGSTYIDSEWQSFIKYNLLRPHFNLHNKRVADIGCNNGYYMFRMLEDKPTSLVGFDPSPLYALQFEFINHFIQSNIKYELLGVEHVSIYEEKFDTIFCLGVLYHRSDPVATLKSLRKGLDKGGELILDTFMIDGEGDLCLTPQKTYSKIPNIYFVPTQNALKNWCMRAGFTTFEVLEITTTTVEEQRKTEWMEGESLNDFLDPTDSSKTVEGYDAPKRIYIKVTNG
jgi:tRNA (mo5U34)-methyltransferase